MSDPGPPFPAVEASLKRVAAALREAGIDFALAGSIAAWARGGPEQCNDVDLLVRPTDADAAHDTLARAGLRTERPPEGWLLKAYDGDVLVDLIFAPNGESDVDRLFDRCEELRVSATDVKVMALEDVLVAKLRSFGEHYLEFAGLLQITRALREQIDWAQVRRRTEDSPYAAAFLHLVEELGVSPPAAVSPEGGR
jgi:hypothetical protein